MKHKKSKPKITASEAGLRLRLTAEELMALIAEIQHGYSAAVQAGVPGLGNGTLTKEPMEHLLIDLVHQALVKLKKKQAENLWENTITLSIPCACALWEFWERGLITYKAQNPWSVNFIRSTFSDMHPLLIL